MKKISNLLSIMILLMAVISCREDFKNEFPDVLIINHPPELLPMDTIIVKPIIGNSKAINMQAYVADYEGDDVSVKAVSENPEVATVSMRGDSILVIYIVGEGTADITVTMDDGIPRDEPATGGFVVAVKYIVAYPPFVFSVDFYDFENGTIFDEIYLADSTKVGTSEGSPGSSRIVQNGVMLWTTEEWNVMLFEFKEPLDLSANPIISLEYADWWSPDGEWNIRDGNGMVVNFWEPTLEMVLNSSVFRFLDIDLTAIIAAAALEEPDLANFDLSNVVSFTWEKAGGRDFPKPMTCRARFIGIGKK